MSNLENYLFRVVLKGKGKQGKAHADYVVASGRA
jgi:hypothetical protein